MDTTTVMDDGDLFNSTEGSDDIFNSTEGSNGIFNSTESSEVNLTMNSTTSTPTNEELIQILAYKLANVYFGDYHPIIFPITLVVCLIGIITNSLNILVFTRKSMKNSVNFLLTSLSVTSIGLMLTQIPFPIHYFLKFKGIFDYSYVQFSITLLFLETLTFALCNWLAVLVAVWMFVAIQYPLQARIHCSMFRARLALSIIILVSVILTGTIFVVKDIIPYQLYGTTLYASGFSSFATDNDKYYLSIFQGGALLFVLIPTCLLLIVTAMLVISLMMFNRNRKRKFISQNQNQQEKKIGRQEMQNYRIAMMLTVMFVLFFLSNIPDASLEVAVFFGAKNIDNARKATNIVRIFSLVNNAVAFFIYYFMGANFRKTFKEHFKIGKLQLKSKYSSNSNSTGLNSTSSSRKNSNSIGAIKINLPEVQVTRTNTTSSTAQFF